MKTKNLISLLLIVSAFALIISCDNEDEKPAYVGDWETNVFTMATSADTVEAKMSFVFTETTFVTEVSLFIAQSYYPMLGVKGSVDEKENQTLTVSLTDIGTWNSGTNAYDWKNRTTNSAEFELLYAGYLSTSMLKDFNAVYQLEGSNLDLIIAAVPDTIHLHKQ